MKNIFLALVFMLTSLVGFSQISQVVIPGSTPTNMMYTKGMLRPDSGIQVMPIDTNFFKHDSIGVFARDSASGDPLYRGLFGWMDLASSSVKPTQVAFGDPNTGKIIGSNGLTWDSTASIFTITNASAQPFTATINGFGQIEVQANQPFPGDSSYSSMAPGQINIGSGPELQFNSNITSTSFSLNNDLQDGSGNAIQGSILMGSAPIPFGSPSQWFVAYLNFPVHGTYNGSNYADTIAYKGDLGKFTFAADNGLTDSNGTVQLGGTLNQSTIIGFGSSDFQLGYDGTAPGTSGLFGSNASSNISMVTAVDPTDFIGYAEVGTELLQDSSFVFLTTDSSTINFTQHRFELSYSASGGNFHDVLNILWNGLHGGSFTFDPLSNTSGDPNVYLSTDVNGTFFLHSITPSVTNFTSGTTAFLTAGGFNAIGSSTITTIQLPAGTYEGESIEVKITATGISSLAISGSGSTATPITTTSQGTYIKWVWDTTTSSWL